MIPQFANNANNQYEQKRIAKEKQESEFLYFQFYFVKLIEWGCVAFTLLYACLLYTSPSPRDRTRSRMPSSA